MGERGAKSMSDDFNRPTAPVLIVPFVWIGDFVRCHSVVKLLRAQVPERPVDIVSSTALRTTRRLYARRPAGDRR